jgi:hypothetical protein
MDEGIHVARFLGRDVILDIEAFDFAGKAGGESCCVKLGDVGDAGFALGDSSPGFGNVIADGDTAPRPVTTTRRFLEPLKRFS